MIVTDHRSEMPREAHDISGAGDRYEALVEVLQHQQSQAERDRELERKRRARSQEREGTPPWVLVVVLVVAAWLWILPPAFLRVEPPPPQPIEKEEASLRFVIYAQARRLDAYRQQTGRYPERLEEAGPPLPGMTYARLHADLYQLTGSTDRLTLTYISDLPLENFLGAGAGVMDEEKL